jgi:hypothetical protein
MSKRRTADQIKRVLRDADRDLAKGFSRLWRTASRPLVLPMASPPARSAKANASLRIISNT